MWFFSGTSQRIRHLLPILPLVLLCFTVSAERIDSFKRFYLPAAAGIILIKEAGGVLNEIDLSVIKNIKIIASSTSINSKLLEKLNNF